MALNETGRLRAERALGVPLLRQFDIELIDEADPALGVRLTVTPETLNAAGWLHAGAIAAVLEVAAYLAVIESLAPDEDATTHGFAACYLAAGAPGDQLQASGELLRRGGHVAFLSAELCSTDRLIATASVTKSLRLL